jgi:hypothetical protein
MLLGPVARPVYLYSFVCHLVSVSRAKSTSTAFSSEGDVWDLIRIDRSPFFSPLQFFFAATHFRKPEPVME